MIQPRSKPQCILESDATLLFGERSLDVTLRAYGRWVPSYSGVTEKGERPSTPPEPAHFSVDSVTIFAGGAEEEIYNAFDETALEEIALAAAEAQ